MSLIFVYGTLKKGHGNNHLLDSSTFMKDGITKPEYKMISLGGFPGVLSGGSKAIKGEVWEVDEKTLKRLDSLEGHPNWYLRTPIELQDGTHVEIYIYPSARSGGMPEVESGDWSKK